MSGKVLDWKRVGVAIGCLAISGGVLYYFLKKPVPMPELPYFIKKPVPMPDIELPFILILLTKYFPGTVGLHP